MKKRQNIYFGPALADLIDERIGDGKTRSVSGVLNAVADRYRETIRRHTPDMTADEWMCIFDALNGVWAGDNAARAVSSLPYGIDDAMSLDGLADKWGVRRDELMTKLESMDWCQRMSVIDAAERFWSRDDWPADSRDALVEAVIGRKPM